MIPDEAVEAAVLALAAKHDSRGEGEYGGEVWNRMVADVKLALESAAPYIAAQAWDEGADAEFQRSVMKRQRDGNPYRPTNV